MAKITKIYKNGALGALGGIFGAFGAPGRFQGAPGSSDYLVFFALFVKMERFLVPFGPSWVALGVPNRYFGHKIAIKSQKSRSRRGSRKNMKI